MKLYTRKGDRGDTSLIGGTRVSKGHLRIESYGSVDELNSHLGVVQSYLNHSDSLHEFLGDIQNDLFVMGSILAADPEKSRMELPSLENKAILNMEQQIDGMNEELEELRAFILPAGNTAVAQCHVARTVCRRAERTVVSLNEIAEVPAIIIEYLNRLSDFLFVLARKIGKDFGIKEVTWQAKSKK